MRLLLVEDSKRLRNHLRKGLRAEGYAVDVASDGEEGLWAAQSSEHDVIILDLMLPKLDGLSLLAKLRQQGSKTHVLILTARDSVEDRVKGLEQGADDYLVKPFAFEELLARVRALVRRRYGQKSTEIALGDLLIDTARREVKLAGKPLALKPREYALLHFLALRRGQVVSRTEIERHIYDDLVEPMSNVVDSAICLLRKKIDTKGKQSFIETRRGMGYLLREPPK